MKTTYLEEFRLIGLPLEKKTTNNNGQSAIDCGNHWQKFAQGNYADRITEKLNDEIVAVYHEYEGDYTQPYSYFIGCKVKQDAEVPEGMASLVIPEGTYEERIAKGEMPDCVANTWKEIWNSDIPRAYQADFEIYGEKSKDWTNAEVKVFLSVG